MPLRYDPGLWSMVFPLGMYCVASEALGKALHVNWLVTVGHDGTWVAFAAWAALFAAMLALLAGLPPQPPCAWESSRLTRSRAAAGGSKSAW